MAIKLPEPKYYTFPELVRRWERDENYLRRLILERVLIPSYVINEFARVVKFEFSCPDLPEYESGYWIPEFVKYDVLHGELEEVGSAKLVEADGFYYLLHPWQTTSLNCTFVYFSADKGHQKDSGETCLMLNGQKPLSLDDVMRNGCVMADEVHRLEQAGPDTEQVEPDTSNENKWPWGTHHTDALGHLEAAAKSFWTTYDSDKIGTAPTNKEVSDWLQKERGVTERMADSIASILRADGIRTGPR
jgi:hypothetical protein